ncbi:MAG: hypothetical protein GYB65_17685 [Chloroflexi bacterium]|nr:hypothetical protein [Chloroflexota bacterium]
MGSDELRNLLRSGIQAAQRGNAEIARPFLEEVVAQDPNNELGWMWLASVASSSAERRECLLRVLQINPNNRRARQALDRLGTSGVRPEAADQQVEVPRSSGVMQPDAISDIARPSGRRRPNAMLLWGGGALAVVMIVLGLVLLVNELSSSDDESSTPEPDGGTPAAPIGIAGGDLPPEAQLTLTPPVGQRMTVDPLRTYPTRRPATVVPPPRPTATPTATPLPLDTYALLVTGQRDGQDDWLYTMDGTGNRERSIPLRFSSVESMSDTGVTLLRVYDGSYAPDGEQIVFTAYLREVTIDAGATVVVEYEDIFVAPADGGVVRPLTTFEGDNARDPTWSPDGTQIAFASDVDGDYDIYIMAVDGGEPRRVLDNDAKDWQPTWSPDGRHLAFASDLETSDSGLTEIWRVGVDGSELTRLTEARNSSFSPAWSPAPATAPGLDREMIAFISDRDESDADLYVMAADGSGSARLLTLNDERAEERDPTWSPDGRWIAFSSNRENSQYELYVVPLTGPVEVVRVTSELLPLKGLAGIKQVVWERGDTRYANWEPDMVQ